MKIDEPKTPYNYQDPALNECDQLDAGALAEKLKRAADSTEDETVEGAVGGGGQTAKTYYVDEEDEESDEEKIPETTEQKGEPFDEVHLLLFRIQVDGQRRWCHCQ